jgi:hypothetical protein
VAEVDCGDGLPDEELPGDEDGAGEGDRTGRAGAEAASDEAGATAVAGTGVGGREYDGRGAGVAFASEVEAVRESVGGAGRGFPGTAVADLSCATLSRNTHTRVISNII